MKKLECHIEVIDTGKANPDYFICTEQIVPGDFCYEMYLYNEEKQTFFSGCCSRLTWAIDAKTSTFEREPVYNLQSCNKWDVVSMSNYISCIRKEYNQV